MPFEIPLKAKGNKRMFETYHGVYISIQVILSTTILLPAGISNVNLVLLPT